MNLNMHIAEEGLGDLVVDKSLSDSYLLNIVDFVMYDKSCELDSSMLYIIDAEIFSEDLYNIKGLNWICIGRPQFALKTYRQSKVNVLVIKESCSGLECLVQLHKMQRVYDKWSEQLLLALDKSDSGELFFETGFQLLGNPMLLFNPVDQYGRSIGVLPDDFVDEEWRLTIEKKPFTSRTLKQSLWERKQTEPFVRQAGNYYVLVTNNLVDGAYYGKICHCSSNKPFSKAYISLAWYFCCLHTELRVRRDCERASLGDYRSNYFIELIHDIRPDKLALSQQLETMGWSIKQASLVIVGALRDPSENDTLLNMLVHRLRIVFPTEVVFIQRKMATIIVRRDSFFGKKTASRESEGQKQIETNLQKAAEGFDSVWGVSREFYDVRDVRKYFEQAYYTVNGLLESESKSFIGFYGNSFFEEFVDRYKIDDDIFWNMHPKVLLLYQYDLKHKSDYVNVLCTCLEHCCNKKDTASSLFIHYNTLIYRLGKITEIAHISLDSSENVKDDLFQILLSCKIIQLNQKRGLPVDFRPHSITRWELDT